MGVMTDVPFGLPRRFDFSGDVPFINPTTGVMDPVGIQAFDPVAGRSRHNEAATNSNVGLPGRVEKRDGATMVRYNAGDGITAGKARTQLNGWPVPPRTHVRWELEVALGANDRENEWVLSPPGESPVLIWQVKSPAGTNPSMAAAVDTDPEDPTNSLVLSFFLKGGKASRINKVATVHGIPRNSFTPIVVEAFLDEREIAEGGKGRMKVWVNGIMVGNAVGPTLTWGTAPHDWALDVYLYNDAAPYRHTRASFWKTARMFVYP